MEQQQGSVLTRPYPGSGGQVAGQDCVCRHGGRSAPDDRSIKEDLISHLHHSLRVLSLHNQNYRVQYFRVVRSCLEPIMPVTTFSTKL